MEENSIIGTCMFMCPAEELSLREHEGLLHRFERKSTGQNRRKADPERTIKCFSRSAAGIELQPNLLRPGPVLLRTVEFLMHDIAPCDDNCLDIYDFVTDRLRAVRQDMTIQRLPSEICIQLLEPMIRFHILFGYLLSNNLGFDMYLNDIHLRDCFGTIINCYKSNPEKIDAKILQIFMCLNLLSPEETVKRLQNFQSIITFDVLVAAATENFSRLTQLAENLDVLARAALSFSLPTLRGNAFKSLCHAINSTYAIERLSFYLSCNDTNVLVQESSRLGVESNSTRVFFNMIKNRKNVLASPIPQNSIKWWMVDKDLDSANIAQLLLD